MKLAIIIISVMMALPVLNKEKSSKDSEFESFKSKFIEALWKANPEWANAVGYHKYDSILVVPDNDSRNDQLAFSKKYLKKLHDFTLKDLSASNQIDYHLIENHLLSTQWSINEFRSWEWNPAAYNVGEGFARLLSENYAPLNTRLKSFDNKLNNVAEYYKAAKKNISHPTIVHTGLAIQQNKGSIEIFEKDLVDSLLKSTLSPAEKEEIVTKSKIAVEAIQKYVRWLEMVVKPSLNEKTARSFRIGKELYDKKFAFDLQSGFAPEEIYARALKRKDELHTEMAKIAANLWPKYFHDRQMPADNRELVRKVIDTISADHVSRENFQAAVEKQLPQLIDFINTKNLLYIDPKKPLVVRQTPDYQAGFSVASIDAPGPYDKNANTYYNVGSLKDYTPEKAESFLREYNKYTMQIINIHEAIPGHYTQLVYSNQSPDLIKTIFENGAMVEGWAVYSERMMLEEGYGENSPELWLMYYKWHLRSVCNTLLDYGLQVKNMSEQEAMALMIKDGFQQQAEATGKLRRAELSQVQLCSYFTGFTEIYALRDEMKKQQGAQFNLKAFHEKFLSYGSAPVKYIRELMME
jgi:uncharacterized protein (DUF885 family)